MTASSLRIDLHLHSTASDGTLSPAEVVAHAHRAGLALISLTDHDTVAGVPAAVAAGEALGIQVLPGIEVTAATDPGEVHILGYGVDPAHPELLAHARRAGTLREDRMAGMIARLREDGIDVSMAQVEAVAGPDRGSLARPHLARVLVEAGYAAHPWEAFDRFIGDGGPAYLPAALVSVEGAIDMIHRTGGVAAWAHPPEDLLDDLLPRFVRAGLDGIEVYRPRNPKERIRRLEKRGKSAGLLLTGGSDWHGPEGGELGAHELVASSVLPFLEAVGVGVGVGVERPGVS